MIRKILALVLCMLVCIACFAACSDEKKEETTKTPEVAETNEPSEEDAQEPEKVNEETSEKSEQPSEGEETSDETQKEEEIQEPSNDSGIELEIKPLEEVDEETLKESAAKFGFANEKLFEAVANAMGIKPWDVTQEDLDKIHYIGLGPESEDMYTVFVGYIDYVDLCFSEAAEDPGFMSMLNDVVMISEFNYNIETDTLSDLSKFRNIEMFEIYDVRIEDVSFVKDYNILVYGYFKNNGITDVSSLEGYNPESLIELDFTGNDIVDWTPLEHIKEKVLVVYDIGTGFYLTLDEYLRQKENPVTIEPSDIVTEETPVEEDTNAQTEQPVLVDENGNPADFSSLFD